MVLVNISVLRKRDDKMVKTNVEIKATESAMPSAMEEGVFDRLRSFPRLTLPAHLASLCYNSADYDKKARALWYWIGKDLKVPANVVLSFSFP